MISGLHEDIFTVPAVHSVQIDDGMTSGAGSCEKIENMCICSRSSCCVYCIFHRMNGFRIRESSPSEHGLEHSRAVFDSGVFCIEPARYRHHTFMMRSSFVIYVIMAGLVFAYGNILQIARHRASFPAPCLLNTPFINRKYYLLSSLWTFLNYPLQVGLIPCHCRDTYRVSLYVYGIVECGARGAIGIRSLSPQIPPFEYSSVVALREAS